jgi:hypothetical protein
VKGKKGPELDAYLNSPEGQAQVDKIQPKFQDDFIKLVKSPKTLDELLNIELDMTGEVPDHLDRNKFRHVTIQFDRTEKTTK